MKIVLNKEDIKELLSDKFNIEELTIVGDDIIIKGKPKEKPDYTFPTFNPGNDHFLPIIGDGVTTNDPPIEPYTGTRTGGLAPNIYSTSYTSTKDLV